MNGRSDLRQLVKRNDPAYENEENTLTVSSLRINFRHRNKFINITAKKKEKKPILLKEKVKLLVNESKIHSFHKKNENSNSVLKSVKQESSILGVSKILHTRNRFRKIIWMLVLVIGFTGCLYQICRFVKVYLQYPVIVNLQVDQQWNLVFPAVTVCNLNRMKKNYKRCLDTAVNWEECSISFEMSASGIAIRMTERQNAQRSCSSQMSGTYDKEKNKRMEFLEKYSKMDEKRRFDSGSQAEEFIEHCSFNDKPCSTREFLKSQTLQYGNCFTFNTQSLTGEPLMTSRTGYFSGLELTLNIDPNQYMSISHVIGARVVVHNPTEDPNPEGNGFDISPRFETSVSLKQSLVRRLPSPYRDHCVDYDPWNSNYGKSQDSCVARCIQERNFAI